MDEVPDILRLCGAGENHKVDLPRFQQLKHAVVLPQLTHNLHIRAKAGDFIGRALGSIELIAQVHQLAGNMHHLRLVPAVDGDEDAAPALRLHPIARGNQPFKQGFLQILSKAQHLPGGFHLRRKGGVCVSELFKGENRHLHSHIGRRFIKSRAVSKGAQGLPGHHPGGKVHHGHPRHLGEIGNRAAGTGIHLNDIQLALID